MELTVDDQIGIAEDQADDVTFSAAELDLLKSAVLHRFYKLETGNIGWLERLVRVYRKLERIERKNQQVL